MVPQAPAPSKSSTGAGKENKNAKTELKEASIKSSNGINVESKPNDQSARPPQTKAENGTSTKPAPMKRGNSSIFKAFAKTRPKAQREDTDSSAAGSVCLFIYSSHVTKKLEAYYSMPGSTECSRRWYFLYIPLKGIARTNDHRTNERCIGRRTGRRSCASNFDQSCSCERG